MTSKSKNKKRVDFSVRPRPAREALPADADQWVREGREAENPPQLRVQVKQKRLTLNLPAVMHTSFKGRCVLEGVTIQDKVQTLIEDYSAADPAAAGQGTPPL